MTDDARIIDHRGLGVELFNATWDLMGRADRTADEDDLLLHTAHASSYHWRQVGSPVNLVRGEWLCSRVYAVLGRPEPSLHHANRALGLCLAHGIADWDLAFSHEAVARAHAVGGDLDAARASVELALAVGIADEDDRELLSTDLATITGGQRPR